MRIKANVSFGGVLSMGRGEIREYNDQEVLSDLMRAGYIEEVANEEEKASPEDAEEVAGKEKKASPKKKAVKLNEGK